MAFTMNLTTLPMNLPILPILICFAYLLFSLPSQHIDIFTNSEALQTPCLETFMEVSLSIID